MGQFDKFLIATQFLTRLPIPAKVQKSWTMEDLRECVHMFPLVGVLVGLGASLVYAAAVFCNLPPVMAAILAVATQILMTGALHEDGFADVCDGFGGGRTRGQKLEIMHDSRLGTYGAIGLMLSLALRIGAVSAIAHPETVVTTLIAAAAL
ncbi:MAG: adenosylcobinamide-GDP ribazoletransferase, partial [Geminicoccaceae bacterium]